MTRNRTVASGSTIEEGAAIWISPSSVQETGCGTQKLSTEVNAWESYFDVMAEIEGIPFKVDVAIVAQDLTAIDHAAREWLTSEAGILLFVHVMPIAARIAFSRTITHVRFLGLE